MLSPCSRFFPETASTCPIIVPEEQKVICIPPHFRSLGSFLDFLFFFFFFAMNPNQPTNPFWTHKSLLNPDLGSNFLVRPPELQIKPTVIFNPRREISLNCNEFSQIRRCLIFPPFCLFCFLRHFFAFFRFLTRVSLLPSLDLHCTYLYYYMH